MNLQNQSLWLSVALLVVELIALAYIRHLQKKPLDPLRPRLVPLNAVFLILVIVAFATLAHVVSILSGVQVKPRSKMGIR